MKVLIPNFCELKLESNSYRFNFKKYDKESFDNLKADYKDQWWFYRLSNKIIALPINDEAPVLDGFENVEISIEDAPYLYCRLIELMFERYFKEKSRDVFYDRYARLYKFRIEKESEIEFDDLKLQPQCCYSIHTIVRKNGASVLFLLSMCREYRPIFNQDHDAYFRKGVDLRDWDVRSEKILATRSNIKKYLERTGKSSAYDSILEQRNATEFSYVSKVISYLSNNVARVCIERYRLSSIEHFNLPNNSFNLDFFNKPRNIYYNYSTYSGLYDVGLKERRPFSYDNFSRSQVNIAAFIPKSEQKQVEKFLDALNEKLRGIFHLQNVVFNPYYVDGADRRGHAQIISGFGMGEVDCCLFFLYREDKKQESSKSAYNKLKSKLINKGIPSQNVLIETAARPNDFTIKNVSLNIYAKLGGTPWVIERETETANEFVIGIGSSIDRNSRRNIGFASVFDFNGSYILGGSSHFVSYDDYKLELSNYLIDLVGSLVSIKSITLGSKIRLVFHLFKSASEKVEISSITECIERYGSFDMDFAIVNLSLEHNFKVYTGSADLPARGTYIQLSEHQALMSMTGIRPLQIRVDRRSTYYDIRELSRQAFFFSYLSCRSFKPANSPVTA
ncbi:MAG: hypothetical protein KBT77_06500 [Thalassolituus oleivorans]|uniref:Piwi domain-containing protein n=1 Tax=Thalassolituus oleivorans TaxID=187493 RepID=UPI001B3DD5E6|nr:Piwi domain-containing protein [Thalassolituus oleivorans]MBQ0726983.1 hypothetical protein [Thalassolituus oleivorans]